MLDLHQYPLNLCTTIETGFQIGQSNSPNLQDIDFSGETKLIFKVKVS